MLCKARVKCRKTSNVHPQRDRCKIPETESWLPRMFKEHHPLTVSKAEDTRENSRNPKEPHRLARIIDSNERTVQSTTIINRHLDNLRAPRHRRTKPSKTTWASTIPRGHKSSNYAKTTLPQSSQMLAPRSTTSTDSQKSSNLRSSNSRSSCLGSICRQGHRLRPVQGNQDQP